MVGWRYQMFKPEICHLELLKMKVRWKNYKKVYIWLRNDYFLTPDYYSLPNVLFLFMFTPPFLASSLTQWRGLTDTTIPQPTVSTCTLLRSPFPRPHPPHRQQSNRNHHNQLSQNLTVNESGSSLNWNAPTPPLISARTWERRPRRRPPPRPLLLSYPPSTERPSKAQWYVTYVSKRSHFS